MYFRIRKIVDMLIAFLLLLILFPLMLVIALLIKLDSKGPVIFLQERIGKNYKNYKICKFRTMIVGAQTIGTGVYSFSDDPRITRLGQMLRKTSLDELPQLWNIIKGEMAFVGPRSPVYGFFPPYEKLNDEYKRRFTVLPGITGLAQVTGRNELSWDEKVKYDNLYIDKVQKYHFFFDLKIWILTIFKVLFMKNISESRVNMEKNTISMNKENEV